MTRGARLGLLLSLALLVGILPSAAAQMAVLEDGPAHVELELRYPAPGLAERDGRLDPRLEGSARAEEPGRLDLPRHVLTLAVPWGTEPRLAIVSSELEVLPSGLPPGLVVRGADGRPISRPLASGEDVDPRDLVLATLEPVGTARHVRLARLVVQPVRFLPGDRSWSAVRRLHLRVEFEGAAAQGAPQLDELDRVLARHVVNPAAVDAASTRDGGGAGIPAPEPSTMTPLRVLVREEGMHQVLRSSMVAAGVDPTGIDPATFVLSHRGAEVAIELDLGGNTLFDAPDDAIRFYAPAFSSEETKDDVYVLTGGVRAGLRMAQRNAAPNTLHTKPAHHLAEVRSETNLVYWGSVPDAASSPWYWQELAVTVPGTNVSTDVPLQLANVSTDTTASGLLEVRLHSRRETPGASPNHHVRVLLNGHLVDEETWTGLQPRILGGSVPQGWVLNGTNTVRIENVADLGLSTQSEYTDSVRLEYWDRFVAEGNRLEFDIPTPGPRRMEVTAFTGSELLAYDVSVPATPVRLTGVQTSGSGTSWTLKFSDALTSAPARIRFATVRDGFAKTPSALAAVSTTADLRARASTGADLLVVASDALADAVQPLVDHRVGQGVRVVQARLSDVLHQFNGGMAEVAGVRNFVRWAFENYAPPAPSAVLLVGDGTYDPADFRGEGDNHVSTSFFHVGGFGIAPSDTWIGAVSGDDAIPDLAVGRMSGRSAADVDRAVDNLLAYETTPPVAALNAGLLYVADDDDPEFEAVLEGLVAGQPPGHAARRVYLADYPQDAAGVDQATAAIKSWVDTGSLVTTYMGHGGRTVWAQESLWIRPDVSTLAASSRLTFTLALNCVNGYFINTDAEPTSLAEEWNHVASRGSAANWAPSATGTVQSYESIAERLFTSIFDGKQTRLGIAAWDALLAAFAAGLPEVYLKEMVFFGDPMTRLPLDSDRDTRLEHEEIAAGTDPDDADSDDDGVTDGSEASWSADFDGDGRANAADPDADDDGLPDGLEKGITTAPASTDTGAGWFVADLDPASTTNPLDVDHDGGAAPDGAEDRNRNGRLDAGETNPTAAADDRACSTARPPEVTNLRVRKDGTDVVLSWDSQSGRDACILYRVYVARDPDRPDSFQKWEYVATATQNSWRHARARDDGHAYDYLVTAISQGAGEGPLGHYGR